MRFVYFTPLLLVVVLASIPAASGELVDFLEEMVDNLLGDSDSNKPKKEGKATKDPTLTPTEDIVLSRLRSNAALSPVFGNLARFVTGDAVTEIAEGRRVFQCITQEAEANTGSAVSRKKVSSFLMSPEALDSIAMGVLYHLFDSPADINVICPKDGDEGGRALMAGSNLRGHRQLTITSDAIHTPGAIPNYPSLDPKDVYKGGFLKVFQAKGVESYLSGDLNDRGAIGALVDQLNDQIVVYQTASQNTQTAGEIIYAVGELISTIVPEGGIGVAGILLDIGATVRGLGQFLQAIASATATNITFRQRTLLKVSNHKSLIDSAEIQASYQNSQMLLAELTSLREKVAELETRL
ncbi:expressed unknown protein [Seminavis robusta]|uniref:Uncharacterized protein n=1 Tax=Seminavis robusta TaxID=568900 RepID=A0A9N8EU23_9STRA|nr:expressed unknown protein [Seminavis robusta]|eukprot:Sro2169_g317350.1 n/a (353) ;mRNA; r:6906-7964